MSHVSKEIYRKITTLFPDLEKVKPFSSSDFKLRGANLNMVVLDATPEEINLVLNRYGKGQFFANLSMEICVLPKEKRAYVKTYKDRDYVHSAIAEQDMVGAAAVSQADGYLYEWLKNLRHWNRSKTAQVVGNVATVESVSR